MSAHLLTLEKQQQSKTTNTPSWISPPPPAIPGYPRSDRVCVYVFKKRKKEKEEKKEGCVCVWYLKQHLVPLWQMYQSHLLYWMIFKKNTCPALLLPCETLRALAANLSRGKGGCRGGWGDVHVFLRNTSIMVSKSSISPTHQSVSKPVVFLAFLD